ncbi:MAG TPA: TetR/AcrR family transcriptional regulator [Acidimicrobiales bacterium]|nr:TetR/AcrR family transcriptional regulator [Acidimicrobiales bacterium]
MATEKAGDPPSDKGRRTRARFIEAGKVVFARDGFLKARIGDIAVEAGVSYGAFYHYFDSKEAIFREIAEEMEVTLLSIDDVPHSEGTPFDAYERIRHANRSYLGAYRRHAAIMRVIEEVSRYDDEVRAVRDSRQDQFAARLHASIQRLQLEGQADPDVDGSYAAMALGGMVAAFAAALFGAGAPFEFEQAVEQLTILWANALGVARPRATGPAPVAVGAGDPAGNDRADSWA